MTTTKTTPETLPVLTPAGSRIPLVGTLCYHDSIGFATVVARSGSRVRISIDDFSEASDVTLRGHFQRRLQSPVKRGLRVAPKAP